MVGRGFLFNSEDTAGDFAFRVDTADLRLHDDDRPRRAALPESTRSVRRKPVRTGPGPEERSAEDTAARPVPRNRRVDRAHGARLRSKAPSLRDSVSEDRRRVPSRREAGGCPPPRVRGEPPGNLFSDESAGSGRSGPDPDGESEPTGSRRGADGCRREIQVHGSQTMCSSQTCDPGARGGARISPRPRWSHSPPGGCGRWRA